MARTALVVGLALAALLAWVVVGSREDVETAAPIEVVASGDGARVSAAPSAPPAVRSPADPVALRPAPSNVETPAAATATSVPEPREATISVTATQSCRMAGAERVVLLAEGASVDAALADEFLDLFDVSKHRFTVDADFVGRICAVAGDEIFAERAVEVGGAASVRVKLAPDRRLVLRGRVVGRDGLPRDGLEVRVERKTLQAHRSRTTYVTTDADGRYEVDVVWNGLYEVGVASAGDELPPDDIDWDTANGTRLPDLVVEPGGVVKGVVRGPTGAGVRAKVTVRDADEQSLGQIESSDDGTFEFAGLEHGAIVAVTGKTDRRDAFGRVDGVVPGDFVDITLVPNRGSIAVRLLGRDGDLVPDSWESSVSVIEPLPFELPGMPGLPIRDGERDAEGVYRAGDLVVGAEYRLLVIHGELTRVVTSIEARETPDVVDISVAEGWAHVRVDAAPCTSRMRLVAYDQGRVARDASAMAPALLDLEGVDAVDIADSLGVVPPPSYGVARGVQVFCDDAWSDLATVDATAVVTVDLRSPTIDELRVIVRSGEAVVPDVRVALRPVLAEHGAVQSAQWDRRERTSSEDGVVVFDDVPAGLWSVLLRHVEYGTSLELAELRAAQTHTITVDLTDD